MVFIFLKTKISGLNTESLIILYRWESKVAFIVDYISGQIINLVQKHTF